jgi:hypothetical protein
MMSAFEEVVANWQRQVNLARDRIRMMESGEMAVKDTFAPFKDWTPEAVETERQMISSLESGIKKLKGL